MLEAQGYPNKKGALSAVAKHLGVPRSTLRGWHTAQNNPPPSEIRREKRGDLAALIESELDSIFDEMPNARQDASYRDLATAAGILIDKKQLLSGEPTERAEIVDSPRERLKRAIDGIATRGGETPADSLPQ